MRNEQPTNPTKPTFWARFWEGVRTSFSGVCV